MKKKLTSFFNILRKPFLRVLPGQLAFSLVLSLIPLIIIIGLAASMFSVSINSVIDALDETLPGAVMNVISPYLRGEIGGFGTIFSLIFGFFIASNGAYSIMVASNIIFDIKPNNYFSERVKAAFLTIILIVLLFIILIILAFGNTILKIILMALFNAKTVSTVYSLFLILKWPIGLLSVFLMVKILFTLAPSAKIPSKYMNLGSVFTTFAIVLVTFIYSYYVTNIADYSQFYGNLANIIVLMVWVFCIAYVIVLGISINATSYQLAKTATNNSKKAE